jgi:MFS family permease
MLLATINSGTLIIALPDLERSLGTSLLQLVWVILAYMIASTVLVLTAGGPGDDVSPYALPKKKDEAPPPSPVPPPK